MSDRMIIPEGHEFEFSRARVFVKTHGDYSAEYIVAAYETLALAQDSESGLGAGYWSEYPTEGSVSFGKADVTRMWSWKPSSKGEYYDPIRIYETEFFMVRDLWPGLLTPAKGQAAQNTTRERVWAAARALARARGKA